MSSSKPAPLLIHGWTVFAHPLFLAQLEVLAQQVEVFKQKDPVAYVKKNAAKRLAAITKLAFDVIPQDPTRPEYRQGGTLCDDHKHWFRAKFFQLFIVLCEYFFRGDDAIQGGGKSRIHRHLLDHFNNLAARYAHIQCGTEMHFQLRQGGPDGNQHGDDCKFFGSVINAGTRQNLAVGKLNHEAA